MASALVLHKDARTDYVNSSTGACAVNYLNRNGLTFQDNTGMAVLLGQVSMDEPRFRHTVHDFGLAKALLLEYEHQGAGFLNKLKGHFCLGLVLFSERKAIFAIDRAGIHCLYYTNHQDNFIFSENLNAMNCFPNIPRQINQQSIFNYLYFHAVPGPQCIYEKRKRLLPGGYVEIRNNVAIPGYYWQMSYHHEHEKVPFVTLREEFISSLRSSVHQEIQDLNVGCFLSGGTDSSTITGLVNKVTHKAPRTFSIGFEQEGYDEINFARIAGNHFNAIQHEHYVSPDDIVNLIPKIAACYSEPFGNSSAVPTYYCAQMAKSDGIQKLLAGDGGDELFAGNKPYATQLVFEAYQKYPQWLRRYLIEPMFLKFPLGDKVPLVKKVRSYIRQANIPMPLRMFTYNHLERFGLDNIFTSNFLKNVDVQHHMMLVGDVFHNTESQSTLNKMMAVDLKFILADNDLMKVRKMCDLAGVDVGFPMLNDRLMMFSAGIPVALKLKGNKLRYFFKKSLHNFLPDAILKKSKHGFGLPFGPWFNSHARLRDLCCTALEQLKKRDIIKAEFIDDLINKHMPQYPSYYGSMVWVLMMLELWLQHHLDKPQ